MEYEAYLLIMTTRSLKTNVGILRANATRIPRDKLVVQGLRIQINHDVFALTEDPDVLDLREKLNHVHDE